MLKLILRYKKTAFGIVLITIFLLVIVAEAISARLNFFRSIQLTVGLTIPVLSNIQDIEKEWSGPFGRTVRKVTVEPAIYQSLDLRNCTRMFTPAEFAKSIPDPQVTLGYTDPVCVAPLKGGGQRDMIVVSKSAVYVVYSD